MMESAAADHNSNATALAAVHCVISAADAITIQLRGEKSVGRDHRDVIRLLSHTELSDLSDLVNQVRQVLDKKHEVEYEGRGVTPSEARSLAIWAQRVLARARAVVRGRTLPGHK